MKLKKKLTANYSRLIRKMLLQMLAMLVVICIVFVAFFNLVWSGNGANFMVKVFQIVRGASYEEAIYIYRNYVRAYAEVYLLIGFGLAFVAYLYFFISRFTRYFSEINKGIDALVQEEGDEIHLLPELSAVAEKLNTVRQNLKNRAQEAQAAEQRKNDLVMYLAHDIRTPLTSVIGYLSLLDEASDMPAEQKAKYTHITLDKALRLEQLVDEFFEITRYNSQHITLQNEAIDLHYMLVQLLDEFYPILSANGNTAVLNASDCPSLSGDAAKLARAFNNLLKNAVSYSLPNTQIIVSTKQVENSVEISFQNEGATIPPEKLSVIFDKFYRLDSSRTSNTGGAGLGLSIAKDVVALHSGSINATSNNGLTTFTISLPLAHETK